MRWNDQKKQQIVDGLLGLVRVSVESNAREKNKYLLVRVGEEALIDGSDGK